MNPEHFADLAVEATRKLGHPLCVGLDMHLGRVPPLFQRGSMAPSDPQTVDAVSDLLRALVPRLAGRVAVVKPQVALFEQLGPRGMQLLAEVVGQCRGLGLLVILDAKRSDIGSSAEGYARAYLSADAALPVDGITLNPYLGLDSLEPFTAAAQAQGKGLFVLVRNSNPGSKDFQELEVAGVPLYERVAMALGPIAETLLGPRCGWSALGAVVGATQPAQAERVRALLPRSLFLVPGFGAQGASAVAAVRGFVPGPCGLEGGLVNSSRGITFPEAGHTTEARVWEAAVDAALEAAIDQLGNAVAA